MIREQWLEQSLAEQEAPGSIANISKCCPLFWHKVVSKKLITFCIKIKKLPKQFCRGENRLKKAQCGQKSKLYSSQIHLQIKEWSEIFEGTQIKPNDFSDRFVSFKLEINFFFPHFLVFALRDFWSCTFSLGCLRPKPDALMGLRVSCCVRELL